VRQDATILTTLTMSSFAGLATALLPWVLGGGTLALHHPFNPKAFVEQQRSLNPERSFRRALWSARCWRPGR
jgi:hypothetical protein